MSFKADLHELCTSYDYSGVRLFLAGIVVVILIAGSLCCAGLVEPKRDTFSCVSTCGVDVPSVQRAHKVGFKKYEDSCFCYAGPVPKPRVEP